MTGLTLGAQAYNPFHLPGVQEVIMTAAIPLEHASFDQRRLVAAAVRNEREAQDILYDRYVGAVYRLAFRMCGDADIASDLTQETFIRTFNGLPSFRHDSKLGTWIHRIAVSVIVSSIRARKRRDVFRAPIELAESVGQQDVRRDSALRDSLYAAINALPAGYRTVFIMYEIEGYSHTEIADALGVTESTSQGQLFRARAKLREALGSLAGEIRS